MTQEKTPEETLGETIRRLRKKRGLSHDRLAAKIGTRGRQVIRWEQDENRPGPRYQQKLVKELGIDREVFKRPVSTLPLPQRIERRLGALETVVASIERRLSGEDEVRVS